MKQMKNMKKFLGLVLALLVVLGATLPVSAATIKISDSISGQTYTAYKIFDVTKSGDNYSYTIKDDNLWKAVIEQWITDNTTSEGVNNSGLTIKPSVIAGTSYLEVNKSVLEGEKLKSFTTHLYDNIAGKTAAATVASTGGEITLDVGDAPGYYFVTSSIGSLCLLNTVTDTITINEKNEEPGLSKTVSKEYNEIGEEITFSIHVTAGGAAATSYVVHDLMENGLTLAGTNGDFTVTKSGVDVDPKYYTVETGLTTTDAPAEFTRELTDYDSTAHSYFTVTLKEDYTKTLNQNDVVDISYKAYLNNDSIARNGSQIVETNHAILQYGQTYSSVANATVRSYSKALIKTNVNNDILTGAKFKLYTDEACTQEVKLKQLEGDYNETTNPNGATAYYRPTIDAAEETSWTTDSYIEAGHVMLSGLNGTYWLKEFEAPDGYNPLDKAQQIIMNTDSVAVFEDGRYIRGGISVSNGTGTEMPKTGGIGTTIFYTIGGILVIGAAVLLISKRRMKRG